MSNKNFNPLTPEEENVIVRKATEPPFTGEYDDFWQARHCVNSLSLKFVPSAT